ncbi:amino acid ABC transporter substrate-binding protein [Pseudoroseicyclus aestuarii]|uniref:L-glutamine-binding protein /L-glutamate-binding protein /L-aspartate-binding protein /L-asparagine-binding protein n=1 Tax=Pseudoroseicyclus aestuarii TaxID=1795041 RepID=A0A318T3V8_9RHOB|nr:amino acid ABC transporter substrate-binding protein [Pseudoroseicyclus aestuarii]PYE84944.1 L-glutamine-binding protein /L-glutamate-binding protein /L-aspartate-binding protein /L-asparagine-binding protein [Pseudoroseicyclus aestuarii]
MKYSALFGALTVTGLAATGASAQSTLETVQDRGELVCGVNTGLTGFAEQGADNEWTGFDVALCKAVAAAVLGDASAVSYVPTTSTDRFDLLTSGRIDMLSRNTTWTYSRDVDLAMDFAGVNYYDGQGFMVRSDMGVGSATELDGATICIQSGTTTELNLADYFATNGMSFTAQSGETNAELEQAFLAGSCDAYTTDASGLAATRASFPNPDDYIILPEIISKEPLGPATRENDSDWTDIVAWTLNALIAAEELGVTSDNVEEMASADNENPEVRRLLGVEGDLGQMMGLDNDWAVNVISATGNYGEIFEEFLGESTPIGLARGLNAQWTDGGLLYAPPFR